MKDDLVPGFLQACGNVEGQSWREACHCLGVLKPAFLGSPCWEDVALLTKPSTADQTLENLNVLQRS